jgi:acyl-coenzyme A synthetase/AMP-(fatty) acid ligase
MAAAQCISPISNAPWICLAPGLYQLYGQGESPMTVTGLSKRMHADAKEAGRSDRLGSCGVPRTGVLVKVVDENDRKLTAGETGEVVTRSDCVI